MSESPLPIFTPSQALEAQVLDAVLSENHSLASIAQLANTTTQALTLWLNTPAIRDHLATLESTAAWRIRLAATFHLDASIGALIKILKNPVLNECASGAPGAAGSPRSWDGAAATGPTTATTQITSDTPQQTRHSELTTLRSLRASESIRRSASTLVRLARFKPIGPTEVVPTRVVRLSEPDVSPTPPAAARTSDTGAVPNSPHIPAQSLAAFLDARNQRTPTDPLPSPRSHKHTPGRTAAPSNPAATLLQSAGSARAP